MKTLTVKDAIKSDKAIANNQADQLVAKLGGTEMLDFRGVNAVTTAFFNQFVNTLSLNELSELLIITDNTQTHLANKLQLAIECKAKDAQLSSEETDQWIFGQE